jgi:hypothetical protein
MEVGVSMLEKGRNDYHVNLPERQSVYKEPDGESQTIKAENGTSLGRLMNDLKFDRSGYWIHLYTDDPSGLIQFTR